MASKNSQVRAIELEAKRRSLADGKSSHKERYRIRADLRREAGLGKERKTRGGVAGFYDDNKSWLVPVAAGVAGMIPGVNAAVPAMIGGLSRGLDREGKGGIGFDLKQGAMGAVEGFAAGKAGDFIGGKLGIGGASVPAPAPGGALKPLPAPGAAVADVAGAPAGVAGAPVPVPAGVPGAASRAAGGFSNILKSGASGALNWLKKDGNAIDLAAGLYGVSQQQKAGDLMDRAVSDDRARWAAGAPLREAGAAAMLARSGPTDTSSLARLSGQGNPFATPAPAMTTATAPGPVPVGPAPAPAAPAPRRAVPRKRVS